MRSLLVVLPILFLACTDDESPGVGPVDSTPTHADTDSTHADGDSLDSGDGGIPFTSYGASDFESFHWSWMGTGQYGAFDLSADCGVTSEGQLVYSDPKIDAAGTATPTECEDLKAYVVSAPYLGALTAPGDACSGATEDLVTAKVVIRDGGTISGGGDGCHGGAFAAAESRMRALREKYAIKPDSGAD